MFHTTLGKGLGMGINLFASKPNRTEYAGFSGQVNSSQSRFRCRQMELWWNKEPTATSRPIRKKVFYIHCMLLMDLSKI
jgi:hypothetical protein